MKIARWGNSPALGLPASVVKALELKEGDEVRVHVAEARAFGIVRKATPTSLLERVRPFRGRLPPDFTVDHDDANAR